MRILRTPHRLLPSVAIEKTNELPTSNGLYYVVDGRRLLYVGKATGFRRRWYAPDKDRIKAEYPSARIYYRERPRWRLATDEAFEIQRLRPTLNIQRPKPGNFPIANVLAWALDLLHCFGVILGLVAISLQLQNIKRPIEILTTQVNQWQN